MKNISKKTVAVLICVVFLTTTIFASAMALKLENNSEIEEKKLNIETNLKKEIITLYRHDLDGSVEAYDVEIEYAEGEDLETVIARKCEEKFLEDSKFIDFLRNITEKIKNWLFNRTDDQNDVIDNGNNETPAFIGAMGLVIVRSRGRGLHLKPFLRPVKLIRGFIPFRLVNFPRQFIFARYNNDNARTVLIPLLRNALGSNVTQEITGMHSTLLIGFAGWATWTGYTSGPLTLLPRVTFGIANVALCRSLN